MAELTADVRAWLGKVAKARKGRGDKGDSSDEPEVTKVAPGGKATAPASAAAAKDKASVPAAAKTSTVAEQIRDAIKAGGINIGIYMVGSPDKKGDKEFKRQADTWAGNHGAFGLSGSKVKKDCAMPLSSDPGKLVTDLIKAMKKELKSEDTIPIANVALFSHGGSTSMKIDSQGAGGNETWTTASSKVIKDFVAAVKPSLTPGAKIHLFACDTAEDRDAGAKPDKKGKLPEHKDDFAEQLEQMTGAEVWGHEDAWHTTGNEKLVEVADTNKDGDAERYQLRDVLARKFLKYVDPSLTEPQMGYLETKLKISDWIKDALDHKKFVKGKTKKEQFTNTDNYTVFVEEISFMGYDKLFDLLIPDTPPDAATFQKMFPEHDEIDKLVAGAAAIHAEFHKDMAKKKTDIAAAKSDPAFPWPPRQDRRGPMP